MKGNWVRSILAVVVAASLVVVAGPQMLTPEPLDGSDWNTYLADVGVNDVGEYASLALDSSGKPHMSYWDRVNDELVYVKWTGSMWKNEIVDYGGMYSSLALDSNDRAHISYYESANENLKYAKWTGTNWDIDLLDSTGDVGSYASLALDSNDRAHISYYDKTKGNLKYVTWSGSSWSYATVDSDDDVGGHTSIAVDSNNNAHISYYDWTHGDLRYVKWTGSQWIKSTVESNQDAGKYTSIAIGSDGNPRISYQKDVGSEGDVRYARWTGSKWYILTVYHGYMYDKHFTSLALDSNDNAHITYGDSYLRYTKFIDVDYWETERVDSAYKTGRHSSIALDSNDNPRIAYHDDYNGDLKYAKWTGSAWSIDVVDVGSGNVGWYTSMAIDSREHPHISYYDEANDDLIYARWVGNYWDIETVDSEGKVGLYTSIALDSDDSPHISYYESESQHDGNLRYARWTGDEWEIETVDSGIWVGLYTSIAIDGSDNPHISYHDYEYGKLKLAEWTGSAWNIATVDFGGEYTSIALDDSGTPHISYYDGGERDLKYARQNGSTWDITTVDSAGNVGRYTSIVIDGSGNPHISYRDDTNRDLKYARLTQSGWDTDTVDSGGNVGRFTSIDLDEGGNPHISYFDDTNDDLKYAKVDGTEWKVETVDAGNGEVGLHTSISLDSDGYQHISYLDKTNRNLKYATPKEVHPVHNIEKGKYYWTIQEAISDATPGNTIEVSDGMFYEKIEIDKTVALVNKDGQEPVIDAGGWTAYAVNVSADGVDIKGLTVTNARHSTPAAGIRLYNVTDCEIAGNNATGNNFGIYLYESSGNKIKGNLIYANDKSGIYLDQSGNNDVTDNDIKDNRNHGILISSSSGNTLSGNDLTGNSIYITGNLLEDWNTHSIDTLNVVNGKPVYYWKNRTGGVVPQDAGQVILANSSEVEIEGQQIINGSIGILLGFSSDNHITDNDLYSNGIGIYLYASEGNKIIGNNASQDTRKYDTAGMQLVESHKNKIEDNDLMDNQLGLFVQKSIGNSIANNCPWKNIIGILLDESSWNNLTDNDIIDNLVGTRLWYNTENNTLYHNYFVLNYYDNLQDFSPYVWGDLGLVPSGRENFYDKGYPSGGNFWDDYAGRDIYHGPNQDVLGSDGIGDTAHSVYEFIEGYPLPSAFEDRFPLTQLWATVEPVEKPPVAMAGGPYTGYEGSPVYFDASGSHDPDGDRLEYRWDLDNDGEWDDGWSYSPVKSRTWEDDYTGTILVEVNDGTATSTDTSSVTVINVAPTVSVGDDKTIDEGDPMFFSATVSDPGRDELTYEWVFGDGHKSAEISPTHTYEDDGIFTVTLTVTDDDDGVGSDSMTMTVENVNPTVSLGPDSLTVAEGETIPLYAFALDVGPVDVLSYEWDLDDDGVFDDGTEQSVIWTAGDDGVYTVSVRVTDDDDGQETDSIDIIVSNVPPIVDATVSSTRVDEGELVNFFGDQTDPGPDTFTYYWEFGDGKTSTDQNPTHSYVDPGMYTVTLTVTDDDLGEGSDTIYMTVESIPPVATATVDQNPADEGVELHFSGDATGSGTDTYTFYWVFDDGGTSTEQNPSHTYMDDGVYVATLTVTDDDDDTDTTWIAMHIDDREPTANAGPDQSVTIIDEVTFDGSGSQSYPDDIVSYEWDFDDGETATGVTVKHTFGAIGSYTVTLTVTDDDGSVDIDTAIVKVLAPGVEFIVGEIVFSPPSPLDVGVDVTISSEVTNYGNTDASNVIVRFYDGDPDENDDGKPDNDAVQIGDDITFTSIESEETVSVSVTWTSTLGYHDIYVWADPDDYIPEYDDTNNQAFDMIVVGPDLIVLDLEFSPTSPIAVGDTVTISVDVTNNGGTTVTDVLVRFYEEYPDQNDDGFEDSSAVQIDDRTIDSLAPGETENVWVSWSPSEVGIYDLSVWVDPAVPSGGGWGGILEAIETNNIATDMMKVGPDLSIAFTDISFSENPVTEGTTVTITAVIHNDGGQDASGVIVKFYDNEIKNKNFIESKTISSLGAGSTKSVEITWEATGIGYHDIWVVIDQRNDIEEYDETNNQAYNVLSVVE